eukprot:COSAG02_NODE_3041_length_7489_cov_7.290798_2_plen_55_part_00
MLSASVDARLCVGQQVYAGQIIHDTAITCKLSHASFDQPHFAVLAATHPFSHLE